MMALKIDRSSFKIPGQFFLVKSIKQSSFKISWQSFRSSFLTLVDLNSSKTLFIIIWSSFKILGHLASSNNSDADVGGLFSLTKIFFLTVEMFEV